LPYNRQTDPIIRPTVNKRMEKKNKITKDSLIRENAVLAAKIERINKADEARRSVLSELLDSYEWVQDIYSNYPKKKQPVVRDWLGIAFLIGELKADADYAMWGF